MQRLETEDIKERAKAYTESVLSNLNAELDRQKAELKSGAIGGITDEDLEKIIASSKRSIQIWDYINHSIQNINDKYLKDE
jgi:hypothetical protein